MPLAGDYYVFGNTTGTLVTASAAPGVVLAPPNVSRKAVVVYNNAPNVLFLKFAQNKSGSFAPPGVTTSDFTLVIGANTAYTGPVPCPTGSILGVWGSASNGPLASSGSALITEIS